MAKDFYTIVGVGRDASQDEIQRAYKKLARKLHPDVNKEADAEDRFKELGEAYDVLKDEERRALYDQFGDRWKEAQAAKEQGFDPNAQQVHTEYGTRSGAPFVDLEDLLGGFGRSSRGRSGSQRRSAGFDREASLTLPLAEAARGGEHHLELGNPMTGEVEKLRVRIPPGVLPGQRIRLAGKGMPGFGGGEPGDLYLEVQIAPDPQFRLEGRDLHTVLTLMPWEAALGAKVPLRTLGGSVRVRVPPGSRAGKTIRLRGKGYPHAGGATFGDLLAEVRIDIPEPLRSDQRELFEKLAALSQPTSSEEVSA